MVSHSSVITLIHFVMSHSVLFESGGVRIRSSGNKVERGQKLNYECWSPGEAPGWFVMPGGK